MFKYISILFFLSILVTNSIFCQTCTTLGQNPTSAFPVCGTANFVQSTVPICGNRAVPNKNCPNDFLTDKNPFWYKFTCFTSGTLGFKITPNSSTSDYDWQLFDITNKNPMDVYSDPSLIIACNWSGETGATGASASGNTLFVCGTTNTSPYRPLFSSMPTIIAGHEYLLLVSHFSDTQSGYSLTFEGGAASTANITDPKDPHLSSARPICDGKTIAVKLNKKMKCNSLDLTGKEFTITPSISSIIGAAAFGCTNSFDMDSLVLTLSAPLPSGKYKIAVKYNPTGLNLVDNCDRTIPDTDTLEITIAKNIPAKMDSLVRLGCAPKELELVFDKPIRCSSIEPSGSDFSVSGPSTVTIISASGNCGNSNTTNSVKIQLAEPIQKGGVYTLTLKNGLDNNTVNDECGDPSPTATTLQFTIADTVSAFFTENIIYGCKTNTVSYQHNGNNNTSSWLWKFDNNISSTKKDTTIIFTTFGQKNATLTVSNGICSDTFSSSINFDNEIKAIFEGTQILCPGEEAIFNNESKGLIDKWQWNFGNGNTSSLETPPTIRYSFSNRTIDYPVRLIVSNTTSNCSDTAFQNIKIVNNCNIAVPAAFTPNNDGLNDYLYPLNAYKAIDLLFKVFNRQGQLVFETRDWTKKWDGTFKNAKQDAGAYVWYLQYTSLDDGKKHFLKGNSILMR